MQRRNNRDSDVLPFHCFADVTMTAGAFATPLSPSTINSARAAAAADTWAHFRVRKLKFRLHPYPLAQAGQALGYVGGVQDTPPSTLAQVMELLPAVYWAGGAPAANAPNRTQQPTEWQTVSKSELAGPLPWYKSLPGGADATEEAPGLIVGAGTGTDHLHIEFRGVFEFKTSVSPANTPAALELRAKLRADRILREKELERTHLLGVLSTSPVALSK